MAKVVPVNFQYPLRGVFEIYSNYLKSKTISQYPDTSFLCYELMQILSKKGLLSRFNRIGVEFKFNNEYYISYNNYKSCIDFSSDQSNLILVKSNFNYTEEENTIILLNEIFKLITQGKNFNHIYWHANFSEIEYLKFRIQNNSRVHLNALIENLNNHNQIEIHLFQHYQDIKFDFSIIQEEIIDNETRLSVVHILAQRPEVIVL